MEIDGTPGVAFEAGVEEARRVLQRGALGEGHLHDIRVCLTGTDHSGVRPNGNPSPLPLLDHFGVGTLDEIPDPSERLAPPITQLPDSRIDQLRGGVAHSSFLRAALPLLHGCCRFRQADLSHRSRIYDQSSIVTRSRGRSRSGPRAALRDPMDDRVAATVPAVPRFHPTATKLARRLGAVYSKLCRFDWS